MVIFETKFIEADWALTLKQFEAVPSPTSPNFLNAWVFECWVLRILSKWILKQMNKEYLINWILNQINIHAIAGLCIFDALVNIWRIVSSSSIYFNFLNASLIANSWVRQFECHCNLLWKYYHFLVQNWSQYHPRCWDCKPQHSQ